MSLKLSKNALTSLQGMKSSLDKVFEDPTLLQWVDLSANELCEIESTAFACCPNLSSLHLHANQLSKFSDIDHIAKYLTKLRSISMHGNPIEEKKHYRNYIIHSLPSLIQLDFSPITKIDREKAQTWSSVYRKKLEARKNPTSHEE